MSSTLLSLFDSQLRQGGHRPALRSRRAGRWITTTWNEWNRKSRAIAAALLDSGIEPGDRVAILSATREEWVMADLAIVMAGAVTVPIYPTLTPDLSARILEDSGAKAVFAESPQALQKLLPPAVRDRPPDLRALFVFECESTRDVPLRDGLRTLRCEELAAGSDVPVSVLADVVSRGETLLEERSNVELLDRRIAAVAPQDLASIVYTARIDGSYKGAMLTHESFCFEAQMAHSLFGLNARDEQLIFLPLAHILGKVMFVMQLRAGAPLSFAQSMLRAIDDAADVNPVWFGAVPRVFERFREAATERASSEGKIRKRVFDWAVAVGLRAAELRRAGQRPGTSLGVQLRYADKLVLAPLRSRFGNRLRFAISGGAPLSADLAAWFEAIGITLYEGYGSTECCGGANGNRPGAHRLGCVGPPLPGVENRIDSDGEILVRGPNVMRGYWGDAERTSEAIDGDGWLHTGDLGEIDPDGTLRITGRKREGMGTATSAG